MQKRPNPENYTFKVTWFCRKQKHIYEILFDILTLGYISSKITDWKICDFFFFLPVIFDRSQGLLTGEDLQYSAVEKRVQTQYTVQSEWAKINYSKINNKSVDDVIMTSAFQYQVFIGANH